MNQTIKAVLWDLDGTLIATHRLYPEAYRRTLAPYLGRELSDEEIYASQARSEFAFLRRFAGEHYDAAVRDFRKHYADLHASHFGGIYPGIPETLDALRKRNIKTGIVTGKTRSSFEITSETADLGQFDVLVMDDDMEEPKPHPGGVIAALDAIKVDPAEAIYVGDSVTDIEAAFAAGATAAAAMWSKQGKYLEAFLERIKPYPKAHPLNEPHEVLALL